MRLRPFISDRPKALAEIQGKPLLEILLNQLRTQGLTEVIISVGHLKDQIKRYLEEKGEYHVVLSEEEKPLGTGGALKRALEFARNDTVLAMNGDTLFNFDLGDFLHFHHAKNSLFSVAVTDRIRDDGGCVSTDRAGRISLFGGASPSPRYMNAGVYAMKREIIHHLPQADAFSLEQDFFPIFLAKEKCFAFPVSGEILDIGTPERYREAQERPRSL